MMRLFNYHRSSTSYRLRIALELKGLTYENIPVNLLKSEQKEADFTARNPYASLPMLEADGRDRAQSMAMLEWLEEAYPDPPLMPSDIEDRFTARELTYAIATELHAPLNLRVLQYMKRELDHDQDTINQWYRHWTERTLGPLEARLAEIGTGDFLFDAPSMFEVVLLPQIYNARRWQCDLSDKPHMVRIEQACLAIDAIQRAYPDNQPDSPQK